MPDGDCGRGQAAGEPVGDRRGGVQGGSCRTALSETQLMTTNCWRRWRSSAFLAPAHNPPYIAAIQAFRQELPGVPLVAVMETGSLPIHGRSGDYLCGAVRMAQGVWHSTLWIPRRQPSLGKRAHPGADGPQGSAAYLLPSRRQFERGRVSKWVADRHQHGRVSAVRAAAEQPRGRHRRLCGAAHDEEACS